MDGITRQRMYEENLRMWKGNIPGKQILVCILECGYVLGLGADDVVASNCFSVLASQPLLVAMVAEIKIFHHGSQLKILM